MKKIVFCVLLLFFSVCSIFTVKADYRYYSVDYRLNGISNTSYGTGYYNLIFDNETVINRNCVIEILLSDYPLVSLPNTALILITSDMPYTMSTPSYVGDNQVSFTRLRTQAEFNNDYGFYTPAGQNVANFRADFSTTSDVIIRVPLEFAANYGNIANLHVNILFSYANTTTSINDTNYTLFNLVSHDLTAFNNLSNIGSQISESYTKGVIAGSSQGKTGVNGLVSIVLDYPYNFFKRAFDITLGTFPLGAFLTSMLFIGLAWFVFRKLVK